MDKFTNIMNELTTIFTSKRKPIVKPVITNCNKILTLQEKKILFEKMYKQPNREWQYTAMEFLNLWWKKNFLIL